jgi:energy-coupling factor transporter ATP-binding protein EcfA2
MVMADQESSQGKERWRGQPIADRQQWTKNLFIAHDDVTNILEDLSERLSYCERSSNYSCMLVIGGSGAGKTTLAKRMLSIATERYDRSAEDRTISPVIQFAIPDPCTPLEISVSILKALGDPAPRGRRNRADTIAAAESLLRECGVRMVLVDNLQDVPARRAKRGIELVGARFRELIDKSAAVWVFLGTKDALKVVNSDPQLIKRIPRRSPLDYFDLKSKESKMKFRRLLIALDERIPLAEKTCLWDKNMAYPIFAATHGILDRISSLLDRAWYLSVQDGRETMNRQDLSKAFDYLYGPQGKGKNPFLEDFAPNHLNAPGEPFEVLEGGQAC